MAYTSGSVADVAALLTAIKTFLVTTCGYTCDWDETVANTNERVGYDADEPPIGTTAREMWFTLPSTTGTPYAIGMRVGPALWTSGYLNLRFNCISTSPDDPNTTRFEQQGVGGGWIPTVEGTTEGMPRIILPSGSTAIDYEIAVDDDHFRMVVTSPAVTVTQMVYLGALNPVGPDVDDVDHWPWPAFVGASAYDEVQPVAGSNFHWFLRSGLTGSSTPTYGTGYVWHGGRLVSMSPSNNRFADGAPGGYWTTWGLTEGDHVVAACFDDSVLTLEGHVIAPTGPQTQRLLGSFRGIRFMSPNLGDGSFAAAGDVINPSGDDFTVVRDCGSSSDNSINRNAFAAFLRA